MVRRLTGRLTTASPTAEGAHVLPHTAPAIVLCRVLPGLAAGLIVSLPYSVVVTDRLPPRPGRTGRRAFSTDLYRLANRTIPEGNTDCRKPRAGSGALGGFIGIRRSAAIRA